MRACSSTALTLFFALVSMGTVMRVLATHFNPKSSEPYSERKVT
jgi:hypothetical protein